MHQQELATQKSKDHQARDKNHRRKNENYFIINMEEIQTNLTHHLVHNVFPMVQAALLTDD